VHPRFQTPDFSTWMAGFVVGIPAGLLDIGTLADLSNIGTLFAFALVAGGVLILRYREPDRPRAFRAPGGPLAPILTIITCVLLMAGLPIMNWIRFFGWLYLGQLLYLAYGVRYSTSGKEMSADSRRRALVFADKLLVGLSSLSVAGFFVFAVAWEVGVFQADTMRKLLVILLGLLGMVFGAIGFRNYKRDLALPSTA